MDEVLCRRIRVGPYGVQHCPNWAHVLYLDVEEGLRAPTCLFEERPRDEGVAPTDGAPRPLRTMHTVAAVDNRLLRFPGDWLHAVPQPALQYLGEEGDGQFIITGGALGDGDDGEADGDEADGDAKVCLSPR